MKTSVMSVLGFFGDSGACCSNAVSFSRIGVSNGNISLLYDITG